MNDIQQREENSSMLSCYRVLDLTNEKGFLCGKSLGDLGADVIKIERPGGDPSRSRGPFYRDRPDPEKSLYWFAFNANKRGLTLDIETADGREIFKRLVKTADVVVESFHPGYMEKIGLGWAVLSQINPRIIMTSISGFGQEGPYKDYNDRDISVWALSGFMYVAGEPDRPPLIPSYPHAYLIGSATAAIGTLIALCHRQVTGLGQQVDCSSQQCLCSATSAELKLPWAMHRENLRRSGRRRVRIITKNGEKDFPLLWSCKDGNVALELLFSPSTAASNQALLEWIKSDGIDPGILDRWNWDAENWTHHTLEDTEDVERTLTTFFKNHTKEELERGSLERRIIFAVLHTAKDQLKFPQLIERGFWRDVVHPELGTKITYPGGFAKPGVGDCGIRFRAPLIGEHNEEIYKNDLGVSNEELIDWKQRLII